MRYYAKEQSRKDLTKEFVDKINTFVEDYSENIKYLIVSSAYRNTDSGLEGMVDFRFQLHSEDDYIGNHITFYAFDTEHSEVLKTKKSILSQIDYKGRIIHQTILGGENDFPKTVFIEGIPIYEGFTFDFNEECVMVSHWEYNMLFFVFEDDEEQFLYPSFVKSVPFSELPNLTFRA